MCLCLSVCLCSCVREDTIFFSLTHRFPSVCLVWRVRKFYQRSMVGVHSGRGHHLMHVSTFWQFLHTMKMPISNKHKAQCAFGHSTIDFGFLLCAHQFSTLLRRMCVCSNWQVCVALRYFFAPNDILCHADSVSTAPHFKMILYELAECACRRCRMS